MLLTYFTMGPGWWIVPWVILAVEYSFILGKMGLPKRYCIISFLAEKEFTKLLFRRMRSFWRPFVITVVFMAGAYYLGPNKGTGRLYMLIAMLVYGLFLARLYYRMARSFGKGRIFAAATVIFPMVFLLILGLGGSQFTRPEFRQERVHSKFINSLRNITVISISVVEVVLLVVAVGYYTIRTYMPRPLATWVLNEVYANSKDIKSNGKAISREEAMGESAASLAEMKGSREHFFPDHSNDKSVVVLTYIIGSNLEDSSGMASANIRMMQDATMRGDSLTFVLEAGGSGRWFTSGIDENAVGRYKVSGGSVEKVMELSDSTCMTEPESLGDFIRWGVKEYPADRYMLVLWDHGGGVAYGYGQDTLNERDTDEDVASLRISEIADELGKSGTKFDVIGFDACLMQDIEIANELEPYADYYLASEETEGGFGWYYTDAFGRLAEDPGLSSGEFGRAMTSTYDQFNTVLNDGKAKTDATLSFVDLTMVKPAADRMMKLLRKADKAIKNESSDFADLGTAASNSYSFSDDMQVDLIDFIDKLDDADINDSICSSKKKKAAADALRACVLYRNRDSAKGINGMAFAFPYKEIAFYSDTHRELGKLAMKDERELFDDVFSIMAVQQMKEADEKIKNTENRFLRAIREIIKPDYTEEEWYVEGFEKYDAAAKLIDIPLEERADGYKVMLPAKTWKIVVDCQTVMYQKDDEGRWRCLGSDQIGGTDENGHPMVGVSDEWVSIDGHLVQYIATAPRETDEGDVYTGKVLARLNGRRDIMLDIEWDPVKGENEPKTGRVTGYEYEDDELFFTEKGNHQLQSGDFVEFMFEYYDNEGTLTATEPYGGRIVVTRDTNLAVTDAPLGECDIQFCGVLTDVYQRELMTEMMEVHMD